MQNETLTNMETLETLEARLEREIAARKQAEAALESKVQELNETHQSLNTSIQKASKNSSRLNAIMNSITDWVVVSNLSFEILDTNNWSEIFIQATRDELLHGYFLDFLADEQQETSYRLLCEAIMESDGYGMDECSFRAMDGTVIPAEVKVSVFLQDDEYYLVHLIRDITTKRALEKERMQMEDELSHAAKWEAVGQLAGGIAHEINTPAQYIGDNLHFINECATQVFAILEKTLTLKKACQQEGSHADLCESIVDLIEDYDLPYLIEEMPLALKQSSDGIAQVSRIVLAMKDFSHPGTTEKEPFNINAAIDTTLTVSRNEWKSVADVETDFDDELEAVHCIPGAINQVFLNLIVNAAHAIDENVDGMGKIRIATKRVKGGVEITVEDNGGGIPESIQNDIFNPFFTTKEVGKGTGQGLSIARDIVTQKHDGSITFETEPGKGTIFKVFLPQEH